MAIAVALALILGLLAIYEGKLKPFRNRWVLFFLGYMLVNFTLAPKIFLIDQGVASSWMWRAMLIILIFALMLFAISSIRLTQKDKDVIFEIITWCGFIVAAYMIFQRFGIEQWFDVKGKIPKVIHPGCIGAAFGSPVVASSFLSLTVPIALLIKKWWKALLMIIAVCITGSQVAIGALAIGLISIIALKSKKKFVFITSPLLVLVIIFIILCATIPKVRATVGDHERFRIWTQIARDLKNPIAKGSTARYALTGYGMGTFGELFFRKHEGKFIYGRFRKAHNDYLELLYNVGVIGLIIFLSAIGKLFKDNFKLCRFNKETRYLMSSFIGIAVCAGGFFVWQLGAHIFYTIVILGLLHNKREVEDERRI